MCFLFHYCLSRRLIMKTRSIRSSFKHLSKQYFIIMTCFIIALINLVIYFNKWRSELKYTNKHATLLYFKSNEINTYNDLILTSNSFDIVISYYSEDVDYVAQYIRDLRNTVKLRKLHPRVIVYNKNSKINNQVLKILLDADIIQFLPNLGREGATYLYHIIEHYQILANHTIFSQAGVEGLTDKGLADWYSDRLENQFNSSVGYMPLVHPSMIVTIDCGTHFTGNFPRLVQIWALVEQTLCPPGGQAVRFIMRERSFFKDIRLEVYRRDHDAAIFTE
ncbi:hypothetical protein I4U23_030958 [Adineta vaga]|nr:hypothetical protein I4U23_030958 [Adineta vaga]